MAIFIKATSAVAVTVAAMAAPTAGLGAESIVPANGKFSGKTSPYVSSHKHQTGRVALTVRGHDVYGFTLSSKLPPIAAKHSHGAVCAAINTFTTKHAGGSGSTADAGAFDYTFTRYESHSGEIVAVDTITLKGTFTDDLHVTGTFRNVLVASRKSPSGAAHCDTGAVPFTATKS